MSKHTPTNYTCPICLGVQGIENDQTYLKQVDLVYKDDLVSLASKKTYDCDGITLRQNNEPAGDQHAFHYHLHIFPRYEHDNFNQHAAEKSRLSDPTERKKYCDKLKAYFSQVKI